MMKIIQISTIPTDAEPMVLGLSEHGGVYRWDIKESAWVFWGSNKDQNFFRKT